MEFQPLHPNTDQYARYRGDGMNRTRIALGAPVGAVAGLALWHLLEVIADELVHVDWGGEWTRWSLDGCCIGGSSRTPHAGDLLLVPVPEGHDPPAGFTLDPATRTAWRVSDGTDTT